VVRFVLRRYTFGDTSASVSIYVVKDGKVQIIDNSNRSDSGFLLKFFAKISSSCLYLCFLSRNIHIKRQSICTHTQCIKSLSVTPGIDRARSSEYVSRLWLHCHTTLIFCWQRKAIHPSNAGNAHYHSSKSSQGPFSTAHDSPVCEKATGGLSSTCLREAWILSRIMILVSSHPGTTLACP